MLKISFYVILFVIVAQFHLCIGSLTINGSVSIHSFIFKKVINAFDYVLVKFDEPFSYGENEEVYKEIAKVSIGIPNLMAATVGIADYGEKENGDLAEKYRITKADYPAYRLFNKDIDNPIVYEGPKKADAIKSFLVKHTGAYVGLEGCLEQFDRLAREFVAVSDEAARAGVLTSMRDQMKGLTSSDKEVLASAEKYVKIAAKIQEVGPGFVANEQSRLRKLTDGNISDNKKIEIKLRLNILQSFEARGPSDQKLEL